MQTGSAPDATISSATDSLRVLTSVATKSTTLTRFSPRGGVISPHGVFCAEASPAKSKNAASRGSARAHAATAAGGARRGSGGASPVSAARNACIACAGPAARFASRTATATSTTFTRGDAAAPECAVAGRGGVVLAASTSFAPEDPSRRDPYIAALSFDETRSSPFAKSSRMASAVAKRSASALGAPRAMPTSTSAAFARLCAVSAELNNPSASDVSGASPSASRSWSRSVVSASHPVLSAPWMALISMPCIGETPGSSAPTSRSSTSATARFSILRTSSRNTCGLF